ncbi:MFS transporter [Nocardiopsis kunsanensis]|uniref:MFS transporter n=1 Tax=Nocardiopsis kunsanensis TaxID=141693 RepID=A0A919CL27_9ACTN|nr:MFS transporter [Nocardiopsis kunsanensis]GHD35269.1 MFS transporter [Nocardiopsis kunsanensis]
MSTESPSRKRRAPLGRDFNRFWAGSLSSNLADGIMLLALPMLAAALTNDPVLVSGLMVARFLPWLLVGLFAGALADRLDRGRVLVVANLVRAGALVVLAALVTAGMATIWTLYAVMFVVMVCEVFYDVAGRAILPALAPHALDRANSRLVGGKTVTEDFAGAPLAGFLFVVAAALPIAVNAGAYFLGALVLLGLPLAVRRPDAGARPATEHEGPSDADEGEDRPSIMADIRAGLRYLLGHPTLRSVLLFNVVLNLASVAQGGVLVLIVQEHFGVPEAFYGVFLMSVAAGALVGAMLAGTAVERLGRFRTELVCFSLMTASYFAFGLAPGAVTAALAFGTLAVASTVSNIVMIGAIQLVVPGTHLGRVMSLVQITGAGLAPVGALLGGLLGRVELYYVPIASGVAVLAAFLPTIPAIRRLTRHADDVERGTVDTT